MRENAIKKIVLLSIVVIVLVAILIVGIIGGGFGVINWFQSYSFSNPDDYNVGNADIDTVDITALDINWIDCSVEVGTHSGDRIAISETNSGNLEEDEKLRYMVKDNTLYIKYWAPKRVKIGWNFNKRKVLTVLIPEDNPDLFKKLKIKTVSANQRINDIVAENSEFKSVSGSVNVRMAKVADKIDAESVSGKLEINADIKSLKTKSVSGSTIFKGKVGEIESNNVSGSIEMDLDNCPYRIDMGAVSGKLTVFIPDNEGFTATYSSVSGDFNCNFAAENSKKKAVYGDGSADFKFSTVSGSINLKKK